MSHNLIDGLYRSPQRITDLCECQGKTVDDISIQDGRVFLEFTDGKFVVIEASGDFTDGDGDLAANSAILPSEALSLGLISREEYEAEKAKWTAQLSVRHDAEDRAEYERLKAKFEPTPATEAR